MGYGRQKQGLVQTANGTKNFSKLAQTIDGGGQTSLVGAYATLAANVFAAYSSVQRFYLELHSFNNSNKV